MVDKKFSDFERTQRLEPNELIASEIAGTKNRGIEYQDLSKQIASDMVKQSATELFVVSYILWESDNGEPINLPKHKLYANGGTYYRSDNQGLVGRVIDYAYNLPTLRAYLQIPNDKSYLIAPDLRNKHIVGAGSVNPYLNNITSKSIDYITNTTVTGSITAVGSSTANLANPAWTVGYISGASNSNGSGSVLNSGTTCASSAITGTSGNGNRTLTFDWTKLVFNNTLAVAVNKNSALVDSVNRVPAIALFPVIDINVDAITLDPDAGGSSVNISDVVGLQAELDSKVAVVDFDAYKTTIYTKTEVDAKLAVKRNLHRQLTGLAGVIGGNSIIRPLDNMILASGVYFDTTTLTFNSGANASIIELVDPNLPAKRLQFALRLVRSGAGNTQLEVGLHRVIDNLQVRTDNIQLTDTDSLSGNAVILSYCNGDTDPFAVGGYYITLRNLTNTPINFSSITLDIYVDLEGV